MIGQALHWDWLVRLWRAAVYYIMAFRRNFIDSDFNQETSNAGLAFNKF